MHACVLPCGCWAAAWLHSARAAAAAAAAPTLARLPAPQVAALHLPRLGAKMTILTPDQSAYINVPVTGPFKPAHYRCARVPPTCVVLRGHCSACQWPFAAPFHCTAHACVRVVCVHCHGCACQGPATLVYATRAHRCPHTGTERLRGMLALAVASTAGATSNGRRAPPQADSRAPVCVCALAAWRGVCEAWPASRVQRYAPLDARSA